MSNASRKVVMISSTARDLPIHREQVRLACERAGFAPREMMEHLTAENRTAVAVSLRMVEAADVYLGVFAYRYGFIPPGSGISITDMEYNRAVELGKPRLVFFIHEDHPVVKKDFDTGQSAEKLEALKKRSYSARIFCLVAIGGMGKSALTWKWFNQIAPNEMKPLAGQLWWSFYESDASFETFLVRALCYVSGDSEEAERALAWPEREARLLQRLGEEPFLFVLDGLERILIAYNRMDASRLADDELDERTANVVAGAAGLPPAAAQSFVGQHRLRQTIDPRAGAFLKKLAGVAKSRILITTRLYPSELQLPTLHPRPGCFPLFLRGLSEDDALGLWRGLGVSGSRAELVPIFQSVESHPLLVLIRP